MKAVILIVFAIAIVAVSAQSAPRPQMAGQPTGPAAVGSSGQQPGSQVRKAKRNRKAKENRQKAEVSATQQPASRLSAAAGTDQPKTQADNPVGQATADAVLVIGLDTSLSVKREFLKTQTAARTFVEKAPPGSLIGIVGFDLEAKKELFKKRPEAINFIDRLKARGGYTDFNRGVDAMLSELQRAKAKREVLIFLTDGQQSVPKQFNDRSDFWQILKRELSVRPEVRAFVLSVNDPQASTIRDLPANVTIFAPASWDAAVELVQSSLAAKIGAQLIEPSPDSNRDSAVEQPATTSPARGLKRFFIAGATVVLLTLVILFVVLRRRRLGSNGHAILDSKHMPENA
ncbi:MAG: vWA domain-containing protein, partial [Terriglobia bacterium]